jgi:hypothetical protein
MGFKTSTFLPRSGLPATDRPTIGSGSVPPILESNQFRQQPQTGSEKGTAMIVTSFRTRSAISAAGAAVVAALALAVTPTAHAADQWGGIAAGSGSNGNWAIWYNQPDKSSAAYFGNWAGCGSGGILCKRVLLFQKCGALAYNGTAFSAADGDSKADAESAATADLPGSWIVGSTCNDGGASNRMTNY